MRTFEVADVFWGDGFQTGAIVDVGASTFRVWLCVRWSDGRGMCLYVTE